jgi:copper(I)-binding protein
MKSLAPALAFASLAAASPMALAHVSLEMPLAEAGAPYRAVLRIGHGCDKSPTTAITVRLPAGFEGAKPQQFPGWTLDPQPGVITWKAGSKDAALPDGTRGEFVIAGTAPRTAGPLWFRVLQSCEQGSLDWADIPAQGTATKGMKTPAALLEVMAPGEFAAAQALPKVEGAWIRASVPGQQGTGGFMRLTAREPLQLVGAATPVAGVAEIHEMKMEGDVMRMRAVAKVDLVPGKPLELKPGGYHLMLMDLKQALQKDTVVPLTLVFRNAAGAQSRMELKVPVAMTAPGSVAGAPTTSHKH